MDMRVIREDKKLCICCMEEHEVKIVHVEEHTTFKNVPINYIAEYYYCEVTGEFYMDESMTCSNNIRMKDAYRKTIGLLTSKEICAIRSKYGITQSDLCTLLGWGGKTITRYENYQVQDKAHDTILKKLDQDPEWFLCLLTDVRSTLPLEAYQKYLNNATVLFEENKDNYLRKSIEASYARFYDNKLYNGNTSLSLDKVVDVIRYFANSTRVNKLYKVKLMKLLWYADALAYKLRGYAITGLVYQALPMGAVPVGHDSIIDLKGVPCEEVEFEDGTGYYFCATTNDQYFNLSDDEQRILDKVIERFGGMTKKEIVSFMHMEPAYRETALWDVILFKYAEYLRM